MAVLDLKKLIKNLKLEFHLEKIPPKNKKFFSYEEDHYGIRVIWSEDKIEYTITILQLKDTHVSIEVQIEWQTSPNATKFIMPDSDWTVITWLEEHFHEITLIQGLKQQLIKLEANDPESAISKEVKKCVQEMFVIYQNILKYNEKAMK